MDSFDRIRALEAKCEWVCKQVEGLLKVQAHMPDRRKVSLKAYWGDQKWRASISCAQS